MKQEIKLQKIEEALEVLYNKLPAVSTDSMKACSITITLLERLKEKLNDVRHD